MAIFNDAATALLLQQPFFGSLFMKFKHVEAPTLNPPTMAVSDSTMYYHPDFVSSITDDECLFVIAHEIMHVVYMHLDRMRHYAACGIGPDGQKYNQQKMNVACDYVINDALKVTKVGTMPQKGCWSHKFPYTMTPEEVYCLLPDDCSGPSAGGGADSFDTHDLTQEDGTPAVSQADVIEAANLCKAMRSDLPAGIDRLIGEISKPPTNPWARLRQCITTALSGYDASSWRRLQRRMIVRGIGMPGRVATGSGTIGIVVDTSGSIGRKMLQHFGGHMASIMSVCRPQLVKIYWTDTQVHRVDDVKTSTQLFNIFANAIPGGGGTRMHVGVRAAIADKCDIVVVLTDGETPWGSPSKKRVVWAITNARIKAPHDETVHITLS